MIQKQETKGVSPVIGVILMVAITVIIAAVVANFVLGLGQQLGEDADATLTFDQTIDDFGSNYYNVTITVSDMQNSDYLVVTTAGDSSTYTFEEELSNTNVPDNAPSDATNSQSATNGGGLLYRSGDRLVVTTELEAGTTIQIFGGIDGEESLVQSYDVKDTLG